MNPNAAQYPCICEDDTDTREINLADQPLKPHEVQLITRHHDGWFTVTHLDR